MSEDRETAENLVDGFVWFFTRILFGWWPVMIVAGMVHHDIWTRVPTWSASQAMTMTLGLTVLAWFFRR